MLVTALTNEAATWQVQVWLSWRDPAMPLIGEWVTPEFAAALSIKLRTVQLGVDDHAKVAELFTQSKSESLTVVPVTRERRLAAARFADRYGIGLCAGGALHVAIAAGQGATICTLDRRLAEAAIAFGVSADLV